MRARWMCGKCLAGMLVVAAGAVGTAVGQVQARPGPTRGVSVEEDSAANTPTGRRIIVAIGIDQYKNWPKLGTAVSDATAFSQLLVDKFGFQEIEKPLIDGAATRSNIMSLVDDRLRKPNLKEDDDVIFFFAGHGTTRTDEVGGEKIESGYLVPVEASAPGTAEQWSDYIPMDQLLEAIARLPAKHILVILDACHSGFALGKAMQLTRDAPRYEQTLAAHVARKVITSAQEGELARDSGPVPDHSLFMGTLLQGLEWGKVDLDGNGVVTSSELGLYLQQAVGSSPGPKQTPDFGSFYFDDRGELVLPLNDHTYSGITTQAYGALRWAEYRRFRQLVGEAAAMHPDAPQTLYLQYRAAMLDNDIDQAVSAVGKLIEINPPAGQIPLSGDDLWNLKERLPYWKSVFVLPGKDFPLTMRMESGPSSDKAAVVEKVKLGDVDAYPVRPHNRFRWQITNHSSQTIFLYAMAIDQDGRIFPFSPLEPGEILTKGIGPGETQPSTWFLQDGELEMQEFHFIASPTLNYRLLSPVSVATRGLESASGADVAGDTQDVERYTTMDLSKGQAKNP
ncbi:MAG: caspase family protein [Acidobacteriaceae bacterium]